MNNSEEFMVEVITSYLGNQDMKEKYISMATVIAWNNMVHQRNWNGIIWQLGWMSHCLPMIEACELKQQEWNELKFRGKWPPPILPALIPYIFLGRDGKWCGPSDLETHPMGDDIGGWILDAMAEDHEFNRAYIWDEVDSDYSFG